MLKYLLCIFFFSFYQFAHSQDFITRWDLSAPGLWTTELSFGVGTSGICSYTWETIPAGINGSGTFSGNTLNITGLPAFAMIRLNIDTTNFNRININNGDDRKRLKDVEQWGGVHWLSMEYAFEGCTYLTITATDLPDLSGVSSMRSMFDHCNNLGNPANIGLWNTANITDMSSAFSSCNINAPIGNWNTANVTDMSYMFCLASFFNQPIGNWNTANATSMKGMFYDADGFNQPIGNWNTANVTDMSYMFCKANTFNQPIGNWNTTNVTDMSSMFYRSISFHQAIGNWNTSNVTSMFGMFHTANNFNYPIGNWNTGNVINMDSMFYNAFAFNQLIGIWNTTNVIHMSGMFAEATSFNQAIGNWNTANVTDMSGMFYDAINFNQPLGNWNTANVTDMSKMFYNAIAFGQSIGNWNTANVTDMSYMFYSTIAFNASIGNWNTGNVANMSNMFAWTAFNQPIGNWNTGNVTDMSYMFYYSDVFNQPIGNWNTANVTDMNHMFSMTLVFNQPIGNWNTGNVQDMRDMFFFNTVFNQPIGNWNTANVTHMKNMFNGATAFNQPIGNWNTSSLKVTYFMFFGATSFNQPLGNWNTANITDMRQMFENASSFNQPLGTWQLNPVVWMHEMLDNSGMDCSNYSATLDGWSNNANIPTYRNLGAFAVKYFMSAQSDRNYLINTKNWTIAGDLLANNNCCAFQQFITVNYTGCGSYFFDGQTLTNSGMYKDTLMNINGCDSIVTLNLTIVTQANVSVTQTGATLTANATGASYLWLSCNPYQEIIGETSQSFTATTNGDYAVVVTQNGCTDTSACYPVMGIGLNEQHFSNNIKIFPNPVSQILQIEAEQSLQNAEINILNTLGQTIASYKSISAKKWSVDMSALSTGNYFVQIKDANNSFVRKVMKE